MTFKFTEEDLKLAAKLNQLVQEPEFRRLVLYAPDVRRAATILEELFKQMQASFESAFGDRSSENDH